MNFRFEKNSKFWQNFQNVRKWLDFFSLVKFGLFRMISIFFLLFFHWEKSVVTRDKREIVIGGWSIRKRVLQCEKIKKTLRKWEKISRIWTLRKCMTNEWLRKPREIGSIPKNCFIRKNSKNNLFLMWEFRRFFFDWSLGGAIQDLYFS